MADPAQPIAALKTLFEENWDETNTDNRLPKVANAEDPDDKNNQRIVDTSTTDFIKIYEVGPEPRTPAGIGAAKTDRKNFMSVDIMIGISMTHAYKVKKEVLRVLEENINDPGTGFQYIDPNIDVQPFSGTRLNAKWRWVVSVTLVQTATTLGG